MAVITIEKHRNLEKNGSVPIPNERRRELCDKLGLHAQALADVRVKDVQEYYPLLAPIEEWIWASFLPKSYSKRRGEWVDYRFDRIPTEVLDEIEFADSLQVFDDLVIRTTEHVDPAVFGVIGRRAFLICRWGEALQPFEKIKELTISRRWVFNNGPWIGGFADLPPKVVAHIIGFIEENAGKGVFLRRRSLIFHRHCGEAMYLFDTFDHHHFVCAACGHSSKTLRFSEFLCSLVPA